MEIARTPIQKSNVRINNCTVFYKRDDLIPFSFGGNKVRFCAEFLKDLRQKGCDTIIGYGSPESNLCRAVASISKECPNGGYIVTSYDSLDSAEQSVNQQLSSFCGVRFVRCLRTEVAQTLETLMDNLRKDGHRPYYIYGDKTGKGNEIIPMKAYIKVFNEIMEQEKELGLKFDYIFLATGTAITYSGLHAGRILHGCDSPEIVGISIARNRERIQKDIEDNCLNVPGIDHIKQSMIQIDDSHLSGGYGKSCPELDGLIKHIYEMDSVPLDPVYTGKAYWGMYDFLIENGIQNKNVLFLHTGGLPLFFSYLEELRNTKCSIFRLYSEEKIYKQIVEFETLLSPSLSERGIDLREYAHKLFANGVVLEAYCHDEVVGLATFYVSDRSSRSAFLSFLAVRPEVRGSGVGSALMEQYERIAQLNGKTCCDLSVHKNNATALRFYSNLSSKKSKERGYMIISENGKDSWLMRKTLGDGI